MKPPRIVIISALSLQLATIEISNIIVGLQKTRLDGTLSRNWTHIYSCHVVGIMYDLEATDFVFHIIRNFLRIFWSVVAEQVGTEMFVTYLVIAFLYDNKWRYNCDRIVDTVSLSQASQMLLQGDLLILCNIANYSKCFKTLPQNVYF